MDRRFAAGVVLTAAGTVAYVVGGAVAYPGRAFSVTAVMVGVTLLALGDPGARRRRGG